MAETRESRMRDAYRLKPYNAKTCCPRTAAGKNCLQGGPGICLCEHLETAEVFDHARMWRDQDGRKVWTSEPYLSVRHLCDTVETLRKHIDEAGVHIRVIRSPYTGGRSTGMLLAEGVRTWAKRG